MKCYLVEEFTKDVDSGITSFYFYKKANDDKFYAGPLWDFDHALGSGTTIGDRLTVYESNTWYANQLYRDSIDSACGHFPTFFAQCYRFPAFRTAVAAQWPLAEAAFEETALPSLQTQKDTIRASVAMNHIRWNTYSSTDVATVMAKSGQDADALISFLSQRKAALHKGFAADGAVLVYDNNGASGKTIYDAKIYSIGETATARTNVTYAKSNCTFDGWNTKADGSGRAIAENESFQIAEPYTVLYAQWKANQSDTPSQPGSKGGFSDFWAKVVAFFRSIFEFFVRIFK